MKNSARYIVTTKDKKNVQYLMENGYSLMFSCTIAMIKIVAEKIVNRLMIDFPKVYNEDNKGAMLAYILYKLAQRALNFGFIKVTDYLPFYANLKKEELEKGDFGAFGDLVEVLVRLLFIGNINLVHGKDLAVRQQGAIDLVSKKFGKIEIGHNGKTWAEGCDYDFMYGKFDSVVYGMFSDADKQKVFEYMYLAEYTKALNFVAKRMCYWDNKYTFQQEMDGMSRGKGIASKGANIQSQSNESRYWMFRECADNGTFMTLEKLLS